MITTKLPSCKLLFIYVLAILCGRYLLLPIEADITVLIAVIVFFFSFVLYKMDQKILFSLLLSTGLFFFFLAYYQVKVEVKPANHLARQSENLSGFKGIVISYPYYRVSIKPDNKVTIRQTYTVRVQEIQMNAVKQTKAIGKILVRSQSLMKGLKIGDQISVKSKAFSIKKIRIKAHYKPAKYIPYWQYKKQPAKLYHQYDNRLMNSSAKFDYQEYLADNEIDYVSYPYKNALIIINKRETFTGIKKIAAKTHYYVETLYENYFSEEELSLIKGFILGKKHEIADYVRNDFRISGVYHILAVSGLHVGMLALFLYLILKLFRLGRPIILLISMLLLIGYVFVVGEKPSILRAVIMFTAGAVVIILDRDRNWLNPLFLAGFFILLLNPLTLFNIGFQLSFLATLGIIVFYTRLNRIFLKHLQYDKLIIINLPYLVIKGLRFSLKALVSLFSLTVSAQLLIMPILVYYFHGFSCISLIANIVIVPLTQLAIGLSFFLPLISFSDYLLRIYSGVLEYLLKGIIALSNFFAEMPINYIKFDLGLWGLFLYYLIIILLFLYFGQLKKRLLSRDNL